eukprot:gene10436-biopygen8355
MMSQYITVATSYGTNSDAGVLTSPAPVRTYTLSTQAGYPAVRAPIPTQKRNSTPKRQPPEQPQV